MLPYFSVPDTVKAVAPRKRRG